jgi:hypothetical protein
MATQQQICRVQILQMLRVLTRVLADAFSARFVLMLWLARLADICQAVLRGLARLDDIRQAVFCGLSRLDDLCQALLHGLARLAKDKFGKFYANLASLANLASVG